MLWWILAYFTYSYFLHSHLESYWAYSSYLIDILFVIGFALIFHIRPHFRIAYSWQHLLAIALGALLCFVIFFTPSIQSPMIMDQWQSILLLCLFGPLLEELLYRFMLMESLLRLQFSKKIVVLVSALAFAASHLKAYGLVSPNYETFILFQGAYTFMLGLWWANEYCKTRNLYHVTILHILFNFGYWLTTYYGFGV
tara:strand:+ start:570 stop:1160 length:591 start_codon:yes stop_codon:yes gene_type:complete